MLITKQHQMLLLLTTEANAIADFAFVFPVVKTMLETIEPLLLKLLLLFCCHCSLCLFFLNAATAAIATEAIALLSFWIFFKSPAEEKRKIYETN